MKNRKSIMTTITLHPETPEQEKALKAMAKALKIKFEVDDEEPYDPEFVAKIQKARQQAKEGEGRKVSIDELNELWK